MCLAKGGRLQSGYKTKKGCGTMKKLVLAVALSAALVTNGQAASAGPLRVNGAPVDASGSYVPMSPCGR